MCGEVCFGSEGRRGTAAPSTGLCVLQHALLRHRARLARAQADGAARRCGGASEVVRRPLSPPRGGKSVPCSRGLARRAGAPNGGHVAARVSTRHAARGWGGHWHRPAAARSSRHRRAEHRSVHRPALCKSHSSQHPRKGWAALRLGRAIAASRVHECCDRASSSSFSFSACMYIMS